MLKVLRDRIIDKKTGATRKLTYNDVECDCDGWVDAKKYFPVDYELVYLKTEKKTFNGWSVGTHWDGLKITDDNKVLYWKRQD